MSETNVIESEELAYAMFIQSTAKACHEANKAFCESIGDNTQVSWEEASDAIKQSAFSGVIYALENPEVTPEQMHLNWKRDKIKAGWIYGKEKSEATRMHPCIVDYKDLPEEQRIKDDIFIAVVQVSLESYKASIQ